MSPQRPNRSRITLNSLLLLPKLLGLLLNVEVEDRPMKGSLPQEMSYNCSRGAAGSFCLHCLCCGGLSLTGYGEEKAAYSTSEWNSSLQNHPSTRDGNHTIICQTIYPELHSFSPSNCKSTVKLGVGLVNTVEITPCLARNPLCPRQTLQGAEEKSLFTSPRRTGQSSGMKFLPSAVWQKGMNTVECEKLKN